MPTSQAKSYDIPKPMVWEAYRRVAANKGAPGIDEVTLGEFEADLKDNLYKIWNRMSSGSYFPPPVRAVKIPKPHGDGVRVLGVPTVADRVAQTVVAMVLEEAAEPRFHPDSYGYRPGKAAWDAIATTRKRCWEFDWVIDLDVQKFFDTVPWDLVLKTVEVVTTTPWVLLYVKRWLQAPLQQADGTRFCNTYAKSFPAAVACFGDDREALLAIHRVPVRHRIRVRTTNLAERGFEEERRRTKVIPRLMSEQATMKLAFATMIRAAERWCRVSVNDIERHQLKLLRAELGLDPPPAEDQAPRRKRGTERIAA